MPPLEQESRVLEPAEDAAWRNRVWDYKGEPRPCQGEEVLRSWTTALALGEDSIRASSTARELLPVTASRQSGSSRTAVVGGRSR